MSRSVSVHLLPALFDPGELRGGIAVMFDVLRASTTILHALANGADSVVACGDIEEARQAAARRTPENVLLAGERGGLLIDGFDLDNSPQRFTRDVIDGKTVVFTTTNGTVALLRSREAAVVYVGAFVNLSALVSRLADFETPVHLVCAGTEGEITAEDACCAGAVVRRLCELDGTRTPGNDEARLAAAWAEGFEHSTYLDALRQSRGGQNCLRLGFERDVEIAATVDLFDFVPVFDPNTGEIRRVE